MFRVKTLFVTLVTILSVILAAQPTHGEKGIEVDASQDSPYTQAECRNEEVTIATLEEEVARCIESLRESEQKCKGAKDSKNSELEALKMAMDKEMKKHSEEKHSLEKEIRKLEKSSESLESQVKSLKKKLSKLRQGAAIDEEPLHLIVLERGLVHYEQLREFVTVNYDAFYHAYGKDFLIRLRQFKAWSSERLKPVQGVLRERLNRVHPYYEKTLKPTVDEWFQVSGEIWETTKLSVSILVAEAKRAIPELFDTMNEMRMKSIKQTKQHPYLGPHAELFVNSFLIFGLSLFAVTTIIPLVIFLVALPITVFYSFCCKRNGKASELKKEYRP